MEDGKRGAKERKQIKCLGCGAEVIASRSDARCPACKAAAVKRKWQEHEKRNRHPCPGCGAEISRTSKQCRGCGQKDRVQKISREQNYAWKGGRSKDGKGYVHVLVAPEKRKGHRYQPEHRVVWEAAHGPLPSGYVVHHISGIKDDNRLENLEALPRKRHGETHNETLKELRDLRRRIAELEARLKGGNPHQ